MTLTHIAIYVIDIIALFMLIGLLNKENLMKEHLKKSLLYATILSIIIVGLEFLSTWSSLGDEKYRTVQSILNAVGFSLTPFVALMLLPLFDKDILKKCRFFYLPSIFNMVLSLLSPWLGIIFYVDAANQYKRGDFYFIFILVYVFNILFLSVVAWLRGRKRYYPIRWRMAGLGLFIIIGSFVQIIFPEVTTTWHTVTLTLFLLYILISELESNFDALTGLLNRLAFKKTGRRLPPGRAYSIIMMDVNDFKIVNDTHGHNYGDEVLREIASAIDQVADNKTTSYRIGGDEFCIVIMDSNTKELMEKVERLRENISDKRKKNQNVPIVAYGVVSKEAEDIYTFEEIFQFADKEMYKHKQIIKDQEDSV